MEAQQQQQQPIIQSSPYASPIDNYGGAIISLTNPEDELYKMELTYRGYKLDKDGNPVKMGSPLMNDEGIGSVVGQVQSIVNQVEIMGHVDKIEKAAIGINFGDTLIKDLITAGYLYHLIFL